MSKSFLSNRFAFLTALAATAIPGGAWADAVREHVDGDPSREVIRMTVTPADEPVPAFKYRLTLLPHEETPGNSVAHYMRAFPEGGIEHTWRRVREKYGDEVDALYSDETPISQLPLDRMREAAEAFRGLIDNYIGPGSRCRETDWGVSFIDIKGPEIIAFLLPEIQGMRSISRAIALRTRLAIADHRYDDALDLLRMNYRLGRDVGKQPILVSGLVGIAICGVANSNVVDFIAAPNAPNLYWALTELPSPQISLREALRLELAIGPRMFEILDAPEGRERTAAEWNALWKQKVIEFYVTLGGIIPEEGAGRTAVKFAPLAWGLAGYAHAKERLLAWGYELRQVEAMAVGQVLSIYSTRAYELIADEYEKSAYFDPGTGRKLLRSAPELDDLQNSSDREIVPIASTLLPAVQAAQSATFRLQRELDALRVLEALRMHAARNQGRWPASLDEIICVPVPDNLFTGKPFEYRLEGDTAILRLPESDGLPMERRYELRLEE